MSSPALSTEFSRRSGLRISDTLLTAANPGDDRDSSLMRRLGLKPETLEHTT